METIAFKSYGRSDIEAKTDCYAYQHGTVLFLSMVGNDSAVKALSSAVLDASSRYGLHLTLDDGRQIGRSDSKKVHYARRTTKLASGCTHEMLVDTRFFEPHPESTERFVLVRPGENPAAVLYETIIKNVPSPTLPAWKEEIYSELKRRGQRSGYYGESADGTVRVIAGYPAETFVLQVNLSEGALDEIVSHLVSTGVVSWEN